MSKRTSGAIEWAPNRINIIRGCPHGCLYCWANGLSVQRKQTLPGQWTREVFNKRNLKADIRPKDKGVMYPSTHDITPDHLPEHLLFLEKILAAYPTVLIVSKPHLACIEEICRKFPQYRDKILFRFTVGSADNNVLKFWEPNAPDFSERMDCLEHAWVNGYQTSLSCEPMLDRNIEEVVRIAAPYITETVWIGKANNLLDWLEKNGHNSPEVLARANELIGWQSDDNIRELYQRLKDNPMIRWKDSVQKIVGLDGPVAV